MARSMKRCDSLPQLSDISQGSVTKHFRCDGIYSDGIIADFLLILTVKQFQFLCMSLSNNRSKKSQTKNYVIAMAVED